MLHTLACFYDDMLVLKIATIFFHIHDILSYRRRYDESTPQQDTVNH
jgi:hypothetical protein